MIAFSIVLLCIFFGWIVSGSVVPALSMIVAVALYYFLVLVRFPLNRLLLAAVVLLLMTLQAYAFRDGYAGIIYEDMPWTFHIGMGCFIWAWMVRALKDGSRRNVGGWYFLVSLAGAVMIFLAASSVEIFRFEPWFVRSMASAPLVLILLQEYQRQSLFHPGKWIIPAVVLIPLLGFLCSTSRDMSARINSWIKPGETTEYTLDDGDASARSASGISAGDGVVELPRRANINVDKSTRFFLSVPTIENYLALTRSPLYLRTSTVSVFEGNDRILPVRKGRWLLDSDDGVTDRMTTLPERRPARMLSYSIILPKQDAKLIPLIEGTNRIRADEVYHSAEGRYQLADDSASEWIRYSALGPRDERKVTVKPAAGKNADAVHLSLPNTLLSERIRKLTSEITANRKPEEAIAEYIEKNCRYALKYRNPQDLPPVENLLFGEKKGHCELFASATVLMLRSAGIPSRIAYGYTGGASNRDQFAVAFRGIDVHAWAEILDENGDWRIFDTTPPERGARRLANSSGGGNIDWRMASFNPGEGMGIDEEETGPQSIVAGFISDISDWAATRFPILFGALLVLAVPAGWIYMKWFRKKSVRFDQFTGRAIPERETSAPARPEFIEAIVTFGEAAGIPRVPGRTMKEYISELQENGFAIPEFQQAVEYFYNTRYGGVAVDPGLERELLKAIRLQ